MFRLGQTQYKKLDWAKIIRNWIRLKFAWKIKIKNAPDIKSSYTEHIKQFS